MRNFQPKRGLRNIIHSWPVLALLGVLVVFFAFGVIGFFGKMQVTRENKKMAENKVAELENKKKELSSEIAKLKTPTGVEESIRLKFGLAKEGEDLIVVVEDKNKPKMKDTVSGGFFSFLFFWKNWFK